MWNCTSAAGSPGRVLTKPSASATGEVSGPDLRSTHSSSARGFSASSRLGPSWASQMQTQKGWSCRFWPTPGRSWRTSTPTSPRWSAGPMPETIISWGDP